MHKIHELHTQGISLHAIARELGIARNTVKKYLQGKPPPVARPRRASKLAPYQGQIWRWVEEDHLYNCVTMHERLRAQGYTGSVALIKRFVHPLRPARAGHCPVIRYETKPGEQLQFDWGEFTYTHADGHHERLYGFVAILGYSRMRFVTFVRRCQAPVLLRCLLEAFEYFGGLPKAVLTDRMKTVLVDMEDGRPKWHPLFADLVSSLGITPRVCKPYTPQTKGKVERSVAVIATSFWPGVRFTDLDELNRQARQWCDGLNQRVHGTTHEIPAVRWTREGLRPVPDGWVWERFGAEARKVSWDGYLSYDGGLYGLPGEAQLAGTTVLVRERRGELTIWSGGRCILTVARAGRAKAVVPHPEQFRTIPSATTARQRATPLGHQVAAPEVATRPLAEYDQLYQVEVMA